MRENFGGLGILPHVEESNYGSEGLKSNPLTFLKRSCKDFGLE